jgi:hypothetical protein
LLQDALTGWDAEREHVEAARGRAHTPKAWPNLDQVPEAGALVVVSFPKPKGGSGFPARVFAILP